jgi:hypothetical protein
MHLHELVGLHLDVLLFGLRLSLQLGAAERTREHRERGEGEGMNPIGRI